MLLIIALLAAVPAQAAFSYRVVYTAPAAMVPSTQTNFPVPIILNNANFKTVANGGHVQNSSGFDIVPYTDAALTTRITGCELEAYSATAGTGILWVNIASLSSSADTLVHVGYGDATISTNQCTTTGTWNANYVSVYHFGNGTTLSAADSTGTANGTINAVTAAAGQLDGAASFSTSSSYIYTAAYNPTSLTIELWLNPSSLPGAGIYPIVISNLPTSLTNGWEVYLSASDGTPANRFVFQVANSSTYATASANAAATAGTWVHVAGTFTGGTGTLYINGVAQTATFSGATIGSSSEFITFATRPAATTLWAGSDDEVRISNVARSADYLLTSYRSATFGTVSNEIAVGAGLKSGTLVTLGVGK